MMAEYNYKRSYVAYLDILGFESKVIESTKRSDVFKTLVDSMKLCGGIPTGKKLTYDWRHGDGELRIQSRSFSDSLCFFVEAQTRALPQLLLIIRYLQDQLWSRHICLRGGVDVGEMYWPDGNNNITLGPGLISAYKLESETAIYPRIVVSQELYAEMENMDSEPFADGDALWAVIETDQEGVHYLNLLHCCLNRREGERIEKGNGCFFLEWNNEDPSRWHQVLRDVQETIDSNLNDDISPNVRIKYDWLQAELNRFQE